MNLLMNFSSTLQLFLGQRHNWAERWVCSPQPAQPLVPLKMLLKDYFPCSISLLGHLGVSRAGYRACDACCLCCAAQSQRKSRHQGSLKPPRLDTPRCKAVPVFKEWDELGSSPGWWWTASQQQLAGAKGHVTGRDFCGCFPSRMCSLAWGAQYRCPQ